MLEIIDKTGVSLKTLNRFVEDGGISYKESNVELEDIKDEGYLKVVKRLEASRGKFHSSK